MDSFGLRLEGYPYMSLFISPVSALPILADLFDVSIDELLDADNKKPAKRGPISKLQQQLDRVSSLPRSKQKFVIEMIDTVIQQQAS